MTLETNTRAGDPGEMPAIIKRPAEAPKEPTLDELTGRIKTALKGMADAAKDVVRRAMSAGEALNQAKAQVDHGNWGKWLKANFDMTERTAQRYMELAKNKQKLEQKLLAKSDTMSDLTDLSSRLNLPRSLTEALELIKHEEKQSTSSGQSTSSNSEGTVSDGDNSNDAAPSVKASDEYDEAEEELIERLEALPLAEAEAAVKETIKRLNKALASKKKAVATEQGRKRAA
jgi:hypothetical protein